MTETVTAFCRLCIHWARNSNIISFRCSCGNER